MNKADIVRLWRSFGYAVVVFNPEELRGADPSMVEERLVEVGNDVIALLAPESDDSTEESLP